MPQVNTPAQLVALLEERREHLGISQRDLGRRAGLSHGAYWFSSNRSGDMSLRAALAYCDVLGLTVQVKKGSGR